MTRAEDIAQSEQQRRCDEWLVAFSATPSPEDDFWYGVPGFETIAGPRISEESALRLNGVWACVTLLADALASVPFNIYERLEPRGKEVATNHPAHRVIHEFANEEQTSFEFWQTGIGYLLMWGNIYALPAYNARGKLQSLTMLRAERMQVLRDQQTRQRYYIYSEDNGENTIYLNGELFHVPGFGFDGLRGYSRIQMLRQSLGFTLAAEEYGQYFFRNRAAPGQYIEHPLKLTTKARDNLNESFRKHFGGNPGSHKLDVLEEGMKIVSTPINHRDIQFLELRKFQLEDIARIFRVPLHLIQDLTRATFDNIEHQSSDAVVFTLRPLAKAIENRVTYQLIGPRDRQRYFAEFNLSGLLRGDAKARAEYFSTMRMGGIMTANEIRALENMNWIEGGDELMIQGAMVSVKRAIEGDTGQLRRQLAKLCHPDRAADDEARQQHEEWMKQVNISAELHDVAELRRIGREILTAKGLVN